MENESNGHMIFAEVGVNALHPWWDANLNYFFYGMVAVALTACFFVLRRKE